MLSRGRSWLQEMMMSKSSSPTSLTTYLGAGIVVAMAAMANAPGLPDIDPFRFPLERFRTLSDDKKAELVRYAERIAGDRIDLELEVRKAAWLVLVGNDVVLASADPQTIPSTKDVLRLGEPRGLVAYLFEAPLIEEELPGTLWC